MTRIIKVGLSLPKRLSVFVSPILRKDRDNVFGDVLKRWCHRCNVAPKVVVRRVEGDYCYISIEFLSPHAPIAPKGKRT